MSALISQIERRDIPENILILFD